MTLLLVLPILLPLLLAALSFIAWRAWRVQRFLGLLGCVGLLVVAVALLLTVRDQGIQVMQVGSWPAPFGITLVADLFSAIMVVVASLIGLVVTLYSFDGVALRRQAHGYFPLLQVLLMGVCGSFLTGDLFNLFVWFELMLIASFVLMTLGGTRAQLEGGLKYVALNLLASSIFLAAVGLLYGVAGTLNMADLSEKLNRADQPLLVTALAMLLLMAFGIKAAIFPLFFWLPASYHTPPVAVSALFSGLLTKVGVYALIRVFTLLFLQDTAFTHNLILVIAGFTMVTGVLGALAQFDVRRLLSFHIISQVGYLLMGLGFFTVPALAATIFFMVHVIIAKSALFLVSGITERLGGSYQLKELGGLYRFHPGVAALFLLPALSLAGIPPLSGFFAKLALIQAGLGIGQYLLVATSLAVSMVTLLSMTKIWHEAFWKPFPGGALPPSGSSLAGLILPVAVLAILTAGIGIAAGPVFSLATQAAEQLMDPGLYIVAVLGGTP